MIKKLSMSGFKSWRATDSVPFGPITALFGTNSSGKTSFLQLLLLLKQTVEATDRSLVLNLGDENSLVELGTFGELVHQHDLAIPVEWDLAWRLPKRLRVEDPAKRREVLFEDDELGFSASVAWKRNGDALGRTVVRQMDYRFAESEFGMSLTGSGKTEYDLTCTREDFRFLRTQGRPWKLPAPAKCYGFPDQVRGYYQNAAFLSDFELQFEELFRRVFYLGPLRDYPKRQYSWAGVHPTDMGRRGERVVDALLAAREADQMISRGRGRKRLSVEERVALWLKDLGLIASFEVRPITPDGKLFQVWVRRSPGSTEVLITDVGFGVSQILPVIVLCYYVPEGSIVLLEQPEIHLHPAVQAGLADVFIDAAKTRNVQIVLESHSEHLLRRLQRRIAEEQLSSDDAKLYFCSTQEGTSKLTALDLDLFGTIRNWPPGFFGDEFGEIAATQEAILKRQAQEQS